MPATPDELYGYLRTNAAQLVGAALGVIDGGGRACATYGATRASGGLPVDAQTRFKWGSFTKVTTAFLICQLAERGLVALDDAAGLYLPRLAAIEGGGSDITLRMLLAHTAGVVDLYEAFEDIDQLVDRVASEGLIAAPGTLFSYSNAGYALLGGVIEAVTGQSFRLRFEQELALPLALQTVSFDYADPAPGENAALDHAFADGKAVPAPAWPDTGTLLEAAGSVTASGIDDLLLVAYAVMTGRNPRHPDAPPLLGEAWIKEMQTLQIRVPEVSILANGWGLGWSVDPENGTVGHTGRTSAYVMGVPAQGVVGAFIASTQSTVPIGQAALRASFGIAATEHPATFDGGESDDGVAGHYVSPLFVVDIARDAKGLFATLGPIAGRIDLRRVGRRSYIGQVMVPEKIETEFNFLGEGEEATHLHMGLRALRRA